MDQKTLSPLLVTFLMITTLSSCFHGGHSVRKGQGEALSKLNKAKMEGSSRIDTGPFQVIDDDDDETFGDAKDDVVTDGGGHPDEVGSKEKDLIKELPGQPPDVRFSQYGGYVTVDKSAGRALYYYFVEAEDSKESLPLLLWLNGGPGCSSLAYGAMEELGPFRVHSDGKALYRNRYSWINAANVLFLESPAGVGFSYSNTTEDYAKSGDRNTARDNYVFVVNWMKRFPEYKDREFFIAGESYAGHYVPQLAHTILYHNKKAGKTIINLKGIIIGNAVIRDDTDNRGMYDFFGSHALTSQETIQKIHKNCNFAPKANLTNACGLSTIKADSDASYVDIYNIYGPMCLDSNLTSTPKKTSLESFDPCSDYYVYAYLNRGEVQEAMHANVTKLNHTWDLCSDVIDSWADSPSTIVPLLQEFMSNGLRVWVYSGDTDGRVPVTSSQYSIMSMKLPIKTAWYPWIFKGEVGGYTQEYKGDLTFATVRGAGHMVPSIQPKRGLALIKHFLNGTPLPKPTSLLST